MTATTTPTPTYPSMVQALRDLLREAKMSQAEAARRSGIPLTTLHRRLTGHGGPILLSELFALREALGVTVTEMATRADAITRSREGSEA